MVPLAAVALIALVAIRRSHNAGQATTGTPKATPQAATPKTPAVEAAHPGNTGNAGLDYNFNNVTGGQLSTLDPALAAKIRGLLASKEYALAASLLSSVPIVGPILAQLLNLDMAAANQQNQRQMATLESQLPARYAQAENQLKYGDTAKTTAAVQKSIPKTATSGATTSTTQYKQQVVHRTQQAERSGNSSTGGVIARPTISSRNLALLE